MRYSCVHFPFPGVLWLELDERREKMMKVSDTKPSKLCNQIHLQPSSRRPPPVPPFSVSTTGRKHRDSTHVLVRLGACVRVSSHVEETCNVCFKAWSPLSARLGCAAQPDGGVSDPGRPDDPLTISPTVDLQRGRTTALRSSVCRPVRTGVQNRNSLPF